MEDSQSPDTDLDRTDQLPILEGVSIDDDVADDAVRFEQAPAPGGTRRDGHRTPALDLPSLADGMRSVEERLARQNAQLAELARSLATAREREDEARRGHAGALRDLASRQRELQTALDTLKARDSQLSALQDEHRQTVLQLKERSQIAAELASKLRDAQTTSISSGSDLEAARQEMSAVAERCKFLEAELAAARGKNGELKAQADDFLEKLRSREWRRGFDQSLFLELDAKIGAAQGDRGALQAEKDRLHRQVVELEARLAARDQAYAKLETAAADAEALRANYESRLHREDAGRDDLTQHIARLEAQITHLNRELAVRDASIVELNTAMTAEEADRGDDAAALQQSLAVAKRLGEEVAALQIDKENLQADLAAKVEALAEHARGVEQRDHAIETLRRRLEIEPPALKPLEEEIKRLKADLAAKASAADHLAEENQSLRTTLERTRSALEEREFMIRRLERSESNNSSVLGRVQTSIERLGGAPESPTATTVLPLRAPVGGAAPRTAPAAPAANPPSRLTGALPGVVFGATECFAEMTRIDGAHNKAYVLSRRTRIGRAPGCEMHIESSSVSRHHALVLVSSRDVTIEDLNSTNGVLVNGRKISRQLLHDMDVVTIGEAQFKVSVKLAPSMADAAPPSPAR